MHYLLFPRIEFAKRYSRRLYNGVVEPIFGLPDGSIIMTVDEFDKDIDTLKGGIVYSFDRNLTLKSLTFSDELLRSHELISKSDKNLAPLDDEHAKIISAKIRYWDGDRFVATPTRNRRYADRVNSP